MLCRIADLNIEFKNPTDTMKRFLKDYITEGLTEITVSITDEDIDAVRQNARFPTNDLQLEITAFHNNLLEQLPLFNAMFLHASLIDVGGCGVAFTALSGTGKSTHTLLWQEFLGDKMQIINGDKPIIRFGGGIPFGYGTPWNGKEGLGNTGKVPIKHICLIERCAQNSCEQISPEKMLDSIFNQIFIPKDPVALSKTLTLLNQLLETCTLWKIKCNTEMQAAQVAYNTIFKEKTK